MSGDSEATSKRTLSVHIGSDDDQTSQSRVEYLSDGSSVSKRESVFDPSPKEASPLGNVLRRLFLPTTSQFMTSQLT